MARVERDVLRACNYDIGDDKAFRRLLILAIEELDELDMPA